MDIIPDIVQGMQMYCSNCGKEMDPDSKFFSECGASVDGSERDARRGSYSTYDASVMVNRKSEGVALVLSIILPGLGHVYADRTKDGLSFLMLQVVLYIISFLILIGMMGSGEYFIFGMVPLSILGIIEFVVMIYAVIRSNELVKEYNRGLVENGQPPW